MKMKIKIESQVFEVEVGNLTDRPIIAIVDGESFEVWPEMKVTKSSGFSARPIQITEGSAPKSRPTIETLPGPAITERSFPTPSEGLSKIVRAPIPGVITTIAIQPGTQVAVGQELCTLEAMKMNNSIRASHAGKVVSIQVSVGQQVRHNDVLMEYGD